MCKKTLMEILENNKKVPFYLFKVEDRTRETEDSNGANTIYKLVLESNLDKTDLEIDAEMKLGNAHEVNTVAKMIGEKYPNVEVENTTL